MSVYKEYKMLSCGYLSIYQSLYIYIYIYIDNMYIYIYIYIFILYISISLSLYIYIYIYILFYLCIYVFIICMYLRRPLEDMLATYTVRGALDLAWQSDRDKWGQSTFIFPKVSGRTFFLNLSKIHCFRSGPISVDPT